MKFFVGLAIYLFSAPLGLIGSLLFYPVHHHPKIELLIVMIGCPLVMNMVQFWIQDSFLMDHSAAAATSSGDDAVDANEGLPLLTKTGDGHDRSPSRLHIVVRKQHPPPQKTKSFTNATTAVDMYEDL